MIREEKTNSGSKLITKGGLAPNVVPDDAEV